MEPSVFYTGIDQHRRSSVLMTYTEDGRVVGCATLPHEPQRLRRRDLRLNLLRYAVRGMHVRT